MKVKAVSRVSPTDQTVNSRHILRKPIMKPVP
jgi:hypothetical protein